MTFISDQWKTMQGGTHLDLDLCLSQIIENLEYILKSRAQVDVGSQNESIQGKSLNEGGSNWTTIYREVTITPELVDNTVDWRERAVFFVGVTRNAGGGSWLPGGLNDDKISNTMVFDEYGETSLLWDVAREASTSMILGVFFSAEGYRLEGIGASYDQEWLTGIISFTNDGASGENGPLELYVDSDGSIKIVRLDGGLDVDIDVNAMVFSSPFMK